MRLFTRIRRRVIAIAAIAGLLFAQAAVAMYACISPEPGPGLECAEAQHDGSSALCNAHCQPQDRTMDQAKLPVISPVTGPVLTVVMQDIGSCTGAIAANRLGVRTGSPPHAILHCSFLT